MTVASEGDGLDAAEVPRVRRLRLAAAWASLGAAFIHAVVSSGHVSEWWGYAAFFMAAAAVQALCGVLLLGQPWRFDDAGRFDPLRGDEAARLLYRVGVGVNVLLVALYALTRTAGVPLLGPEAGQREPVDAAGVLAIVLELALAACLLGLRSDGVRGGRRSRRSRRASG